jgi:hypothetical protein
MPDVVMLLQDVKEKLALYRAEHSGAYVGGVEYSELVRRIDKTIRALTPTPHEITS